MLARIGRLACLGLTLAIAPAYAQEAAPPVPPSVDPAMDLNARGPSDVAIIIGNESYAALPQPSYAVNDARSVRDYFIDTVGLKPFRTKYMENVSRDTILKETKKMVWKGPKRSTVWVYFSGHGQVTKDGKGRMILGTDATLADLDARGVELNELADMLGKNKRVARIVFILDAGFGNISRDGLELIPGHEVKIPATWNFTDERVSYWAAASDGGPAHAWRAVNHGLFTWTVLGGLRGWADGELDGTPDGKVTFAEAQGFARRVPRAVGRVANPTVVTDGGVGDWVLAQGSHLEKGPDDDLLERISLHERDHRFEELTQRLRAEATAFWQDTLQQAQGGGEAGREALEGFITEFENATVTLSWGVRIPEVREARRILGNYDEAGGTTAGAAAVAAADVEELAPCDDLVVLEAPAMLGTLSPGQRRCLEARITTERLQTSKDKISRILLVNAEVSSNTADWERLMARHLEDIDRSDPDMAMRYAIFLFKAGGDSQEESIRWADVALENKARWEGDAYVKKVTSLYRLRAEASNQLWSAAEKEYRKDSSRENEEVTQFYRGWTKDYAREWLDYARASGGKTELAFNLCTSAAGTNDFCKSGP